MCRSRKCCVSFVLALLLSSVSLVPCFASSNVPDLPLVTLYGGYYGEYFTQGILPNDYDSFWWSDQYVKSIGVNYSGTDVAMLKDPVRVASSGFDGDNWRDFTGTVGFEYPKNGRFGFMFTGGAVSTRGRYSITGVTPAFEFSVCSYGTTWQTGDDVGVVEYSYTGSNADTMYGNVLNELYYSGNRSDLGDFRLSGAYTLVGSFTPDNLSMPVDGFGFALRDCYHSSWNGGGDAWETGYLISSAVWHVGNDSLFDVVSQILTHTASIDGNMAEMVDIINGMYTELQAIGADTKTMVELLTSVDQTLSVDVMDKLTSIDDTSKQIYELLYNSLSEESESLTNAAQDAADRVAMNSNTEQYFQDEMAGTFNELQLQNFSFGTVLGGVELAGRIFSSMWSAWGDYVILFTFPLFMGVALLVIGRISKTGGGNSSRDSEHKGGEGGA